MQLEDLEFQTTPDIDSVRQAARSLKAAALQLSDMDYVHEALTDTQRPNYTGMTFAEFYRHQGPQGLYQLTVKPGRYITESLPKSKDALITERIYSELGKMQWGDRTVYKKVSHAVLTSHALEQFTRERLAYLLADAVGMGSVHAPILPIEGDRKNFLLSGSLVMGSGGDIPIDLVIDGQHDQRWWDSDGDALKEFVPIVNDHPKLWSLMCANLPFRAFIGDFDHNPGAYVLTLDRDGQRAPYTVDSGSAFYYINDKAPLSSALRFCRVVEKFTRFDFVERGAYENFDMEIIREVTKNIYRLSSGKMRDIVEAVAASVPFFVLGGQLQTVDHVCFKLEESARH